MARYNLRAVSRDPDGKVTNVVDSWPLNALTLEGARAEADNQNWGLATDMNEANAFEVVNEAGRMLTWRAFNEEGQNANWL